VWPSFFPQRAGFPGHFGKSRPRKGRLRPGICRQQHGLGKAESWANGGANAARIRQWSNCADAGLPDAVGGAAEPLESSH
jgi:hypothetical protein